MNVCLYLIQIHISEPIGTKLSTHLPRGLEETAGHVWAHNISPFPLFRLILLGTGTHLPLLMAAGTTLLSYCVIPVMRPVLV
jgi:hypothetical protein